MNTTINPAANSTADKVTTPSPARKPAPKIQAQGHFGLKTLIISVSMLGTMGGWGALALNHVRDVQAKQIEALRDAQFEVQATGANAGAAVLVARASTDYATNTTSSVNEPTIRTVPKINSVQPTARVQRAPTVASSAPKSTHQSPVLVARNDVPTRVAAPVLRDVTAQPRPVRRTRSSR